MAEGQSKFQSLNILEACWSRATGMVKSHEKQGILKQTLQTCKDLIILTELTIVQSIIGSDNNLQHRSEWDIQNTCNHGNCAQIADINTNRHRLKFQLLVFMSFY